MVTLHRLLALSVSLLLLATLTASGPALAQGKAPPSWKEIDQLVEEQKVEAAAQGAESRLAQAKAKGDEDEWARALIRTVQLRISLHGYETAVRFLVDQPWPKGLLPHTAVELFYAQALVSYTQAYQWEVLQRERVVSAGPVDLKVWTHEQILTEAHRAFAEVWKDRERLGSAPVQSLSEYIAPNSYPAGIRSTLRDAVTYLWVGLLADTSTWRPEQSQELYQLELGVLLAGTPSVDLTAPEVHPLMKVAAILGDLEAWHRGAGRREAELEARLARYERLHAAFTQEEDQTRIRQHLATFLEGFRKVPWWAMGQGLLAELEREADHRVRAHDAAKAGAAAYPKSLGGQRCAALVSALEAPDYSLESMSSDGPRRRSIQLTHRNLPALYFRAYPFDLEKRLGKANDYNLLPEGDELRELLGQKPVASWSTQLPATPDFQDHRTFVTPTLSQPGTYVIVSSAREDFREADNLVRAVFLTVTPYALIARADESRRIELRVVEGETGRPAPGVEARLFLMDYQHGHREVQHAPTDSQGEAVFNRQQGQRYESFLVVVGRGKDSLLLQSPLAFYERSRQTPSSQALVFTDRSVYRPLQKILWKVVAFQGSAEQARYKTQPNLPVTVSLYDPNGQAVEKREVRTNSFGSAAGEFTIPAGRVLGQWRVATEPAGMAYVRVEEYKRPTFEVTLKDPEAPLRLNRPATFRGEARYYFGLPVVNGSVRWRAYREPVFIDWWFGGRGMRPSGGRQLVATGTAPLAADGSFQLTFTPKADEREAKSASITWSYRVEVDVTDEGGETRSANRAFRLGFVAVEARVEVDTGFFLEGTPAELRVTRSNLDGVPQPGKGSWRLVALQQPVQPLLPAEEPWAMPPGAQPAGAEERISTPGDLLQPRWTDAYSPESTLHRWADSAEQAKGSVEHDAQGVARVKLPALKPGAYRLQYETVDAFGQKFTTARDFLVAGASAPVALPAALQLERTTVKVGDTARLLAFSGFETQPLFLDVFQGEKRLQHRQLARGKEPAVIELPVTEELRGGFTVVLVAVRDYQLLRFVQPVFVPFDDKELSVEFTTFRDRMRPGGKETWRVTVRGPKGAKVEAGAAELLAYMYDQSLDLFAPHTPPSVSALYPARMTNVDLRSSLSAAMSRWVYGNELTQVLEWTPPTEDRLRFLEDYGLGGPGARGGEMKEALRRESRSTNMAMAARAPAQSMPPPAPPPPSRIQKPEVTDQSLAEETVTGHGAQAGPGAAPQEPPRSNFAETAFWIPQLLTGQDGSATLEFTVPDSVTAWSVVGARGDAGSEGRLGAPHDAQREGADGAPVRPALPARGRQGGAGGGGQQRQRAEAAGHVDARHPGHRDGEERALPLRRHERQPAVHRGAGEGDLAALRALDAGEGGHGGLPRHRSRRQPGRRGAASAARAPWPHAPVAVALRHAARQGPQGADASRICGATTTRAASTSSWSSRWTRSSSTRCSRRCRTWWTTPTSARSRRSTASSPRASSPASTGSTRRWRRWRSR